MRGADSGHPVSLRDTTRRCTDNDSCDRKEAEMGKVVASASMSLDGYIAKDDNTIGRLFDWYRTATWSSPPRRGHHVPPEPAERRVLAQLGLPARRAGLRADAVRLHRRLGRRAHHGRAGRRRHPPGAAGWVEAHPGAPFHFVTDGVEAAVAKAQEIAGDRTSRCGGTVARQCLDSGCSTRSRWTWCRW